MSHPATPEVSAPDQTASGISTSAPAYQLAAQQSATPTSAASPAADIVKDVVMSDRTPDRPASPAMALGGANAPSPAPPRTGTPSRTSGTDVASRATSQHPDPAPMPAIPKEAPPHGAPTRQYLNSKVTTVLLEGMKQLAKEQPKDPLRVLGEYLLQRSKELEGN